MCNWIHDRSIREMPEQQNVLLHPTQSIDFTALHKNFAMFALVADVVMGEVIEVFLQKYPQLWRMTAEQRHRTIAYFMHNDFVDVVEKIKNEQKELFLL